MTQRIRLNLLRDTSRHFRGKLAEIIFERVVHPLRVLKKLNCYCSTYELRRLWGEVDWYLQYVNLSLEEVVARLRGEPGFVRSKLERAFFQTLFKQIEPTQAYLIL